MPQTESSIKPQLGIRLDREQPSFTLPDTIVGHVFRQTHLVTSKAVVKISLVGRSKSRMIVRHGSWGRTYRGRFPLVDETKYTYTLSEAPLHIPVGGAEQTWPFAITLPTQFDAVAAASGVPQEQTYLPSPPNESAMRKLPPSFVVQDWGFGYGMECFVEYFLQADLTTTGRGAAHSVQAILPVTITTLDRELSNRRSQWNSSKHAHGFKTSEVAVRCDSTARTSLTALRPEISNQPSLDFAIAVQTPKSLRLDQTEPIAFFILAEPNVMNSSDIEPLTSQEPVVTEMLVDLIASTSIKCQARKGARHSESRKKFRLSTKESFKRVPTLSIPWVGHSTSINGSTPNAGPTSVRSPTRPVNAGEHIGLQLPEEGISESFTTHNIHHSYCLEWQLTVQLAEQSFTSCGADNIEMIPPSVDSAPVDYEILEANDMAERTRSDSATAMPPEYSRTDTELNLPSRPRDTGGAHGLSRLWMGF